MKLYSTKNSICFRFTAFISALGGHFGFRSINLTWSGILVGVPAALLTFAFVVLLVRPCAFGSGELNEF